MIIEYKRNGEFAPIEVITIDGNESVNSYENFERMQIDLGASNEYREVEE